MMPHFMQQQVVLEGYALRSQAHKAVKHQLCEHIKQLEKALQQAHLELFHTREQLARSQELADVARSQRQRKHNSDDLLSFYDTFTHNKQETSSVEEPLDAEEPVDEDSSVEKPTQNQDPEEEDSYATHKTVKGTEECPSAPVSRSSFQELLKIQKQEAEDAKASGVRWHQLALRQLSAERLRSSSEPPAPVAHSSTTSEVASTEVAKAPLSFRQLVAIRDATGSESGWHRAALRILAKQRKQHRLQVSCDHDGSNDKQPLSNTNSSASTLSFSYESDLEV